MKREKLFTIIAALIFTTQFAMAQSFDLSAVSSDGVYTMKVGGKPQDGVFERIAVTLPEYNKAVFFASPQPNFDGINQLQPWYASDICDIYDPSIEIISRPQNCVFFLALELKDGSYMAIQPISAEFVMSWIEVKEKNLVDMVCGTMGKASVYKAESPIFAYAKGDDLYGVLSSLWGDLLEIDQVQGRTTWRSEKEYAELYKYLGWCSWEQYKKQIDEPLLISSIDAIERSEVPVRWVLIDDGHQTVTGSSELVNFTPNERTFPNGWSNIMEKRSDKIKWFGLWHCMYGLWHGISEDHTMEDLSSYLIKVNKEKRPFILGESDEGSKIFYDKLINSVSEPGFDFVKVDVQTRDFANYIMDCDNPVVAHRQNAENLEAEAKAKLDGLMNCMAQNLPCIFNTRYSATTRVSIDYKLNDITKARSHIYQSFQNSSWMGQTIWPDHDMFHSSDTNMGRFMAVSKAMSAAPIYLSDAPTDFLPELISPLAYSDGELLRPLAPGVPLPDSFFANALMGEDVYSVIAPMTPKSAAIVAYNISHKESTKSVTITEEDYKLADAMVQPYPGCRVSPKEGLVYYDWYEQKGALLQSGYSFDLDYAKDRLILLTEVENGWSVIGRQDKYLSTIAVKSYVASKKSIEIELQEAGPILVYSNKRIKSSTSGSVKELCNNIYVINAETTSLTLSR